MWRKVRWLALLSWTTSAGLAVSPWSFAEDKNEEAWRSNLSEFTKSVAQTAMKAKVPDYNDLMNVLRSKTTFTPKGDTVPAWVLDGGWALDGGRLPAGEVQAKLTMQFTAKVWWEGEVESVEADAKTTTVQVQVRMPIPKDLPKRIGFARTTALNIPATGILPKKGTRLAFTGELKKAKADDQFPPVFVLYGVGLSNAGQVQIGINLAEVKAVEGR